MKDQDKTKAQLISEVAELRTQLAATQSVMPQNAVSHAAEAKTERDRATLASIVESTHDPIFSVDRDYCYTSFNRSHAAVMKTLYGVNIELGKCLLEYQCVEADRQAAQANLDRAMQGQHFVINSYSGAESRFRAFFEIAHNPIVDDDGAVVGVAVFARDITEQQRASEALRRLHADQEQRIQERTVELQKLARELAVFKQFAESASQGLGIADLDHRIIYLNPAMGRLIGETDLARPLGRSFWSYYEKSVAERGHAELIAAFERDGHWDGEMPMHSSDGSTISIWHHAFALRDSEGSPLQYCVIATDISERKRAEEALRESEQWLRMALQAAGMVTWEWDICAGTIRYSSNVPEVVRGDAIEPYCSIDALIPEIHPDDRAALTRAIGRTTSEGVPYQCEYRVKMLDGTYRWISGRGNVVERSAGKPSRAVGISVDITANKDAEMALRESDERLRLAIHAAQMGAFEWRADTGANVWTTELEALHGLPPGSFDGTTTAWLDLVHPDDRFRVQQLIERSMSASRPVEGEWRIIWPDGTERWIAGRWQAFHDDHGNLLRCVGVDMDITARKLAEAGLQQERQALWMMLQASEHDRSLISSEIHDGLVQYITVAKMYLQSSDALKATG